jgi:hypothetical protein
MGLKRAWWMAVVSVVMISVGTPAYARQEQVSVCHREDNGSYHRISVAASAVATHLAHGDALPGEDSDCEQISACPCGFSLTALATFGITSDDFAGAQCKLLAQETVIEDLSGPGVTSGAMVTYLVAGICDFSDGSRTFQSFGGLTQGQTEACHNDMLNLAESVGLTCEAIN